MTLADRIVVMREGLIEQVGSPLDIYGDPVSHFVADFFGSPSMNLISGGVAREGGRARFQAPGLTVELPAPLSQAPAGQATLGFRPEHLAVSQNGGIFRSEVRLVEPLGKDTLLYFDRGAERPLIAVVEGTRSYREGDSLGVSVDPERLYLFGQDGKRIRGSSQGTGVRPA